MALNKDRHRFRKAGLIGRVLLVPSSSLSPACSHVLVSPACCGCISPSTSPHYMGGKPQLTSATISSVSFLLHSFPSNGDKQLRFTGSEGVLF